MACPSAAYLDEIATTPSGLSLQTPHADVGGKFGGPLEWSGNEPKYTEWYAQLLRVLGATERSWMQFKQWPSIAKLPAGEVDGLSNEIDTIRATARALRVPWSIAAQSGALWTSPNGGDAEDDITATVKLIEQAQCLRQRLDEKLADMGGRPEPPGTKAIVRDDSVGILGKIGIVLGAGAVITGGIYVMRKVAKR